MRSRISLRDHPLHPALVSLPIGLFTWVFISDIVYLATDRDMTWYEISYWTGLAAVVSALLAAVTGLGDYVAVASKTHAKGVGLLHGVLNVGTTALYFVAFLLMIDENATEGARLGSVITLHAVGLAMVALSGWLGGEMVFRHHIGMVPDDAALETAEQETHVERRPRVRPSVRPGRSHP
jgi:uncharacterized membrane protein